MENLPHPQSMSSPPLKLNSSSPCFLSSFFRCSISSFSSSPSSLPSSSDQHWALCLPPSHLLPLGGGQERSQPRPVWRRLWDHPPQPIHLWTPSWEVPPCLGRSHHLFCRICHRRRIFPSLWSSPMGGPQDVLLGTPLIPFISHSNLH